MCNFAPPDMVGHTGKYDATVTACEETDRSIVFSVTFLCCDSSRVTRQALHGDRVHTMYHVRVVATAPEKTLTSYFGWTKHKFWEIFLDFEVDYCD
jgi:bisphosphoglycerate-independent phosphoglycerate mutase (AlkP superfamily)